MHIGTACGNVLVCHFSGKNNVIGVDLCLRNLDTIVFVMPYIPHRKFSVSLLNWSVTVIMLKQDLVFIVSLIFSHCRLQ